MCAFSAICSTYFDVLLKKIIFLCAFLLHVNDITMDYDMFVVPDLLGYYDGLLVSTCFKNSFSRPFVPQNSKEFN